MSRALALSLLLTGAGQAHEPDAQRRVLVSVEPTRVQLVVRHTLKPSAASERLFNAFDANRDGRVSLPTEKLAQAQLLVPRARAGLTLLVDDVQTAAKVVEVKFRELPGGKRRGVETLLLLEAPLDGTSPHRVTLKVFRMLTTVEAQVSGLKRTGTSLSVRPKDPVVGPETLADGSAWIEVAPAPKP